MRFFALVAAVCVSALILAGCGPEPGETKSEIARRHDRVLRINNETMMSDIDWILGLDKPTMLTDKRVP